MNNQWFKLFSFSLLMIGLFSCDGANQAVPQDNEEYQQLKQRLSERAKECSKSLKAKPDEGLACYRSLEQEAKAHGLRKTEAMIIAAQSEYFRLTAQYDSSVAYLEHAFQIMDSLEEAEYKMQILINLGTVYRRAGNLTKALESGERALVLASQRNDTTMMAYCLTGLGNIYGTILDFPKAIEAHTKAAELGRLLNNPKLLATNVANIAIAYADQSEYATALDYQQQAIALIDSTFSPYRITNFYQSAGISHLNLGQLDEAESYFRQTLDLAEQHQLTERIGSSRNNLADVYAKRGQLLRAIALLKENLTFNEKNKLDKRNIYTLQALARLHLEQGRLSVSTGYANQALALATETREMANQIELHEILAEVYSKAEDYQRSNFHLEAEVTLKDSIFSRDREEITRNAQVRFATAQKEQENINLRQENALQEAQLSARNWQIIATGGLLLLVLAIVFLLVRHNRQVQQLNGQLVTSNDQLNEHNDQQKRLLLLLTHDFRTPLTYIYGWLNILKLQRKDISELPLVNYSLSTLKRMENYVSYVIAMIRRERFNIEATPEVIELGSKVKEWVEQLSPIAAQLGVQLVHAQEEKDYRISSDPLLLHHVFDNLMSNALKYSKKGTAVDYELTRTDKDTLQLSISNLVDDVEIAQMQVQEESQSEVLLNKSHGVGLSMVTTYVQALGGEWGLERSENKIKAWVRVSDIDQAA